MGSKARSHKAVHRFLIVESSVLVVVLTLGEQLQQVQRPLLALIGTDVLEYRSGLAVLRDDDGAVPRRCSGNQLSGAPLEGGHGLDVVLQIHVPEFSTEFGAMITDALARWCGSAGEPGDGSMPAVSLCTPSGIPLDGCVGPTA